MSIGSPVERPKFPQLPAWAELEQPKVIPLSTLWAALLSGTAMLVDSQYSEQRCFATIQAKAPVGPREGVIARRLMILERVLLGESQKSVAIDLGIAVSSVAYACHFALAALGEQRSASRALVLFAMCVHSARGFQLNPGRVAAGEDPAGQCWTVSVERPDWNLPLCLSVIEQAVVRMAVEGRTHAEIAATRKVSPRTIANQLASVFRKLCVSGRSELICYLIRENCTAL